MMKTCYLNAAYAIHPNGIQIADGDYGAIEPDYKNIIKDANQRRRMSRVVKMGVAAALLCLEQNENKPIDAILTATGLGCLSDTEKFMNSVIDNDEKLLNPTPFIQSTFNVIGAQIALLTNNHCYNNTYTHRALSFESALLDAMMCINEGQENVLVGASEERTTISHSIMKRLGMFKDIEQGEGSQFFVVSKEQSENSLAELLALKTFIGQKSEKEIINTIKTFLSENRININEIDLVLSGRNNTSKEKIIYSQIEDELFPRAQIQTFKDICGEYHTASAFALWSICTDKQNKHFTSGKTALIYNQFQGINHSVILLRRC